MQNDADFIAYVEARIAQDPRGRFNPGDLDRLVAIAKRGVETSLAAFGGELPVDEEASDPE
jgi:hypothetical protein